MDGGAVRRGQPHGAIGSMGVIEGSFSGGQFSEIVASVPVTVCVCSPMVGNLSDMIPRSAQAPLFR